MSGGDVGSGSRYLILFLSSPLHSSKRIPFFFSLSSHRHGEAFFYRFIRNNLFSSRVGSERFGIIDSLEFHRQAEKNCLFSPFSASTESGYADYRKCLTVSGKEVRQLTLIEKFRNRKMKCHSHNRLDLF